ncbi:hypothetical protein BG454_15470 [Roseinatronobacter bogoriensis subsp. barguzinensis]|uniref:Uncharacterized protein n=2 Tax=Roseinatronobacter bogoriensis TaxID=119542 RepID=A0A2K8KMX6_9RHOB|nr:hypothetical protein [Rhodobaca barguzinensis]ATX67950.1 hypothetical protein BG454_15470 [Rhodobaca barguzinensis]
MFILSPDTVANRTALDIRWLPRRFLGRTILWPRKGGWRLWLRVVFETEVLRYALALLPFVVAALVWQDYAIIIAKAPILMLIAIYLVEARLLRATSAQRAALVSEAQADSGLDMLRARARAILTKIAAGRGLQSGCLHLVIEQSDLLRVAPLSLVSVQSDEGPELLALDEQERALIEETLFAPPLTERALQRIGLARKIEIHDISFEPVQVSAHARMAALMAARSAGE